MNSPIIKARDLRLVRYQENTDYDENLIKKQNRKNEAKISLGLSIDTDAKTIEVTIDLSLNEISQDSELTQDAFNIKTSQIFFIENMNQAFPANEKGEITFPSDFCNQLGAITIAESRGIIASIPKRKEFTTMNIPLFEWKDILMDDLKMKSQTIK